MKKMRSDRIIYSLCIQDLQTVAKEVLERRLTQEELALASEHLGDYVHWFDAIENVISYHIKKRAA